MSREVVGVAQEKHEEASGREAAAGAQWEDNGGLRETDEEATAVVQGEPVGLGY